MSKLKTAPLTTMKYGVWVNLDKCRRVLNKVSFYYGYILACIGILMIIFDKQYFWGVFLMIYSLPMVLIKYSYFKWEKIKNE